MSFEHAISLNIHGVFIMMGDQVFDGLINLYDGLGTNKVLITFESLIYGKPSTFNNDVRSQSDLLQFKYFLRKCKAELLSDVLHTSWSPSKRSELRSILLPKDNPSPHPCASSLLIPLRCTHKLPAPHNKSSTVLHSASLHSIPCHTCFFPTLTPRRKSGVRLPPSA